MRKITGLFIVLMIAGFSATAQDSTNKELIGKYKFPAGTIIEEAIVTLDNGIVNMSSSQGVSVLEKMKGDTFNIVSFNGIAVFKRDAAKKITGVHVDASGYVMDGEKQAPSNFNDYISIEQALTAEDNLKEKQLAVIREAIASRSVSPKIIGCIIP